MNAFHISNNLSQNKNKCLNNLNSSRFFGKNILNIQNLSDPKISLTLNKQKISQTNPNPINEYIPEISKHLHSNEQVNTPNYNNIFLIQKSINNNTRSILIDWLIHIHYKMELHPETLYLSINIIDLYTEKQRFDLVNYQLIGITSLFIASKYEEIYSPELNDFVYVVRKIYTKEDIIHMEYLICKELKFDFMFNSSFRFLSYYYMLSGDTNIKTLHLAQLFLETAMLSVDIMKYNASLRASSALFMARKILLVRNNENKYDIDTGSNGIIWNSELKLGSGYNLSELKYCMKKMILFFQSVIKESDLCLKHKFNSLEYSRVAMIFNKNNQR